MGLTARIWVSKWVEGGTKEKKEEKEEKFLLFESIGHRPLRGRCPKGDQPTDRPTDRHSGVWHATKNCQ